MLQRKKRGYRLVTESGGGGAAERAVKSDSPISDLLLSVHPKGLHRDFPPPTQNTDSVTAVRD